MTEAQKVALAMSRTRQRLNEIGGMEELTDEVREESATLERKYADLEVRSRALTIAASGEGEGDGKGDGDGEGGEVETRDAEARERAKLRSKVRVTNYISAAMETRAVRGESAEGEYNAAIGMGADQFPLRLLAPDAEARATTDTDGPAAARRWLDRLFADAAARQLGVTFESVGPGVATHLVTTAGATAAQRGREEAAGDAAWTVGVTEMKPSRNSVRAVFTREDAARLPGLEASLQRDLRAALADGIDASVFTGDDGANANTADIVGLNTAAGVTEATIAQGSKSSPGDTLAVFGAMMDGKHAARPEDLQVVASVGAAQHWFSTIANTGVDTVGTLAQFLRDNGLTWATREGIAAGTADGDFAAFVGLARGIAGAGVAAVWDAGELIRDPYSGAAKGEVALTLHYLWAFALPRASNFRRVKFVA